MLKTLHGKLSAVLFVILLLVGVAYFSVSSYTTRRYLEEVNQNLNRSLASDLAEHLGEKNLLRANPQAHQKAMKEISALMVINRDIEIYILDAQGNIVSYSAAPGVVQSKKVSLAPIKQFLAALGPLPILGDDPRHSGQPKIFSAALIPQKSRAPDHLNGYVYIILGGDKYNSAAQRYKRSYILRQGLWAMTGSLVLACLAGAFGFAFLTKRLRRLTVAVDSFQSGKFGPDSLPQGDEIAHLQHAFQQMSARIISNLQEREIEEARRRETVTNVSHDLRTPLASLQIYLEALLLKEGRLAPEEQRAYLQTALKHSQRLGKLIAALFELAKLDAHDTKLHIEPFGIGELIQDVVQEFQLTAEKKQIQLSAHFPPEQNIFLVNGDIAMIARVLENLLDNALRYTPEGGSIKVVLRQHNEQVEVCVQDSGRGIATDDLERIFDRSYSLQNQPADYEGAGLGLAIARRIIELHNGTLKVQSAPDEGAVFLFSLPLNAKTS